MTTPLRNLWSARWLRVVAGAVEDAAEDHPFAVSGLLCALIGPFLALGIPIGAYLTALGLERAPLSTHTCVGIALLAIGILCCDLFCHASEIICSGAAAARNFTSPCLGPLGNNGRIPSTFEPLLFQGVVVFGQPISTIFMFGLIMDGGVRLAACFYTYLGYAAVALPILVFRRKQWTWAEALYVWWGWAPIIAFGVPLLAPMLQASGLIRVVR